MSETKLDQITNNVDKKSDTSILRIAKIQEKTGLAKSTIYKYVQEGHFPAPIKLGPRASGWREDQVNNWINSKS